MVAYKDLFLLLMLHIHCDSVASSCDPIVLPSEPRLTEKHLSGTLPVIVSRRGKREKGMRGRRGCREIYDKTYAGS